MAIFSVSFVIVLADRTLLGGAFGYIALVSGLLGIAALLTVKFLLKEPAAPEYLPKPDETSEDASEKEGAKAHEKDANAPMEEQDKDQEKA